MDPTPYIADPKWLQPGDTAWQLVAATLVGLMSIPGLAVLYGGIVQRRWAVNSALMAFYAFAMVLMTWSLWSFNMGFGTPMPLGPLQNIVGIPGPVLSQLSEQAQANIPLLKGLMPEFRFPQSALVYFQFVFAAITPLLFLGSVVGRMNFRAWMLLIPLWNTLVYAVDAFGLWGGGWLAQLGAVDYSGGYVIHLSAGVTGFVLAAILGPRLAKDRAEQTPNNMLMVMVGAGLLWLGWNGFNGGDPYFANADASAAVINTNLAAAAAMLTWLFIDMFATGKPSMLGAVNGMITGLVAITPAAGYVNGLGALIIGIVAATIPWFTMNKVAIFRKVDDALGVVHTHGIAGLIGGLMVGLLADPNMVVYLGSGKTSAVTVGGLFYGAGFHQLLVQALAALFIIVYNIVATTIIAKVVSIFIPLRLTDEELEAGDIAVHGEEVGYASPLPEGAEAILAR
ncbi:MAG: ammonium transporter [Chloroflexi bacterium]|nr:ammonium transporter [Chloroflexota bacterium]